MGICQLSRSLVSFVRGYADAVSSSYNEMMPRPSVNNRANLPRVTTCGDDTALPRNVNIDVPYNPSLGYFSPPAPIRPRSSPFRRFRRFCLFCLFCSGPAQVMRAHKNLHEHKRQNRQNRRNRRNRQNRRTHVAARGLRRQVGVQHCFITSRSVAIL